MSAFRAIVKLTWKSVFRSHVFQFLLGVLIVGTLLIPNTIKGDGSAYSLIQVSLEYSLSFITIMLMLSGIWLGCQTMTQDVEDARIHLIVVKPVSRSIIWLGKFTGVLSVLTLLLIISTAAVYGFISWEYRKTGVISTAEKSSEKMQNVYERLRINNEILTGRRVYWPEQPDIDAIVREVYTKKMAETNAAGRKFLDDLDEAQRAKSLAELRRQTIAQLGEVRPGMTRLWTFKNLPENVTGYVFLRYKINLGQFSSETRTSILGAWGAEVHYQIPVDKSKLKPGEVAKPEYKTAFISRKPEQMPCGMTNEVEFDAKSVIANGTAVFGFSNFHKDENSVFFQQADGPKLLIRAASFMENFIRAVIMQFLGIAAITLISTAAASFLSFPTAIFFALSYVVFGAVSMFMRNTAATMYSESFQQVGIEYWGYRFCNIVLAAVIPFQNFSVSDYVANGELIELSMLGTALFFELILKALPIALLGIWLYNRRELALASTKR